MNKGLITPSPTPTLVLYEEFQKAFNFYNERLFVEEPVPQCLIVMTRKNRTHGYLIPSRWGNPETNEFHHELALNPVDFAFRTIEEVLSTLVHEMVHGWQVDHGKKVPKKSYHNREWADRMEEVGLIPSNTGEADGKRTGQSVSHYIDTGGEFFQQTKYLLDTGWVIPYIDIPEEEKEKKRVSRPKYTCAQCEITAWGKTGLKLRCENCNTSLEEEVPEEDEDDQQQEEK